MTTQKPANTSLVLSQAIKLASSMSINAVVRRSNLDAEANLSFIRAAIDVAINDAADNLIGDEDADAADYLKNKEIEQ